MGFIVNNTTFPSPLDLLIPHSCRGCNALGAPLCECCKNNIIISHINYCPLCKKPNPTGNCSYCKELPPIFVVSERSSLLGDLIHDFKYQANRTLAQPLAEILHQTLPLIAEPVSIVPLPTIQRHIRERSFDHTLLISQKFAKLRGPNYKIEKNLIREQNTIQVGSDAKTRKIQAKTAYKINHQIKIDPNRTYLLFDDVWTTGASMRSAIKKMQEAGAEKVIVALLVQNSLN